MKMMFRNVVEEEAMRNYNNAVKTAETRGREEGRAEGRAEGREEGRAEGEKVGREKGRFDAKIESAKNLLKAGVDINIISTAVGLSIEEIEKLK